MKHRERISDLEAKLEHCVGLAAELEILQELERLYGEYESHETVLKKEIVLEPF